MQQRIASLIRRVVQQQQASHKKEVSAIEREMFFGPNARTLFLCVFLQPCSMGMQLALGDYDSLTCSCSW